MLDLVFFPSHEFKADRIRWLVSLRFRASTLVENCLRIRHRTQELYFIFIPTSHFRRKILHTHSRSQGIPGPRVYKRHFLSKKNTVNYIPPDRQGDAFLRLLEPLEKNYSKDIIHLRKLSKIYLQPIHNSAVQSLARHNFRTTHHLSRYLHFVRTAQHLSRHIHKSLFESITPLC